MACSVLGVFDRFGVVGDEQDLQVAGHRSRAQWPSRATQRLAEFASADRKLGFSAQVSSVRRAGKPIDLGFKLSSLLLKKRKLCDEGR